MKKTQLNFLGKAFLVLSIMFSLISCEKEIDSMESIDENEILSRTPLTEHIVRLGFDESGIKDMGDYYTVAESDIIFEKSIYSYLDSIKIKDDTIQDELQGKGLKNPLYRYYNRQNGDHFYTTFFSELEYGDSKYYLYEGIECYVPVVSDFNTQPLYRYYNRKTGDHFYTIYFWELGGGNSTFKYEGIQCYTYKYATGDYKDQLKRYWNGNDHMYNASPLGGIGAALNPKYYNYYEEGNVGYVEANYSIRINNL